MITDELKTLFDELRAEIVAARTEIVLLRFAVEKTERQVEEIYERLKGADDTDPYSETF